MPRGFIPWSEIPLHQGKRRLDPDVYLLHLGEAVYISHEDFWTRGWRLLLGTAFQRHGATYFTVSVDGAPPKSPAYVYMGGEMSFEELVTPPKPDTL